jgi:hypothetical protein
VGIPEGRRPLGRPRCRCDDNITMDLQDKEMDGACRTYGRLGGAYTILVGTPKRKRPLGRPRRRLEDNIKMKLPKL